jgi:hypothetical protein
VANEFTYYKKQHSNFVSFNNYFEFIYILLLSFLKEVKAIAVYAACICTQRTQITASKIVLNPKKHSSFDGS